ncbi:hypothetical protein PSENEW3_20000019 (mitochondrion) [Picochlorum sp. SENEW3]|nr:hypothetical protein PSENEW3_20000019 [Picochlorum sp. SENEW3]
MTIQLQTQWIVGFVDGEGCFHIGISKHPECTLGYQVLPEFTVVQHAQDVQVLYALKHFWVWCCTSTRCYNMVLSCSSTNTFRDHDCTIF